MHAGYVQSNELPSTLNTDFKLHDFECKGKQGSKAFSANSQRLLRDLQGFLRYPRTMHTFLEGPSTYLKEPQILICLAYKPTYNFRVTLVDLWFATLMVTGIMARSFQLVLWLLEKLVHMKVINQEFTLKFHHLAR